MNQLTSTIRFENQTETARCEYDDGNPGTILSGNPLPTSGGSPCQRRAGAWAQDSAATYYDDGEAATILV